MIQLYIGRIPVLRRLDRKLLKLGDFGTKNKLVAGAHSVADSQPLLGLAKLLARIANGARRIKGYGNNCTRAAWIIVGRVTSFIST